jgi:hypothetical protein
VSPDIEQAEAEEQMGERFQKLPLHSIVCIRLRHGFGGRVVERIGGLRA